MASEITIIGLCIVSGVLSGMLVNYLADTLPWKRRFARPFCFNCDTSQPWSTYFIFPRRCKACGTRRNWRTWLVEATYIGLALWLWNQPPAQIGFWGGWLVLIFFGVIVLIDLEHRLILHPVSWVGAGLGLVVGLMRNGWWDTVLGGAVGYATMWLLYWLGELIMRGLARLKKRSLSDVALGYGDVNLSGILGLMLGWPLVIPGLFLSILIGGAVSLVYLVIMVILRRYQLFTALPYGPFLIAGAFIFLFLGEQLIVILGY